MADEGLLTLKWQRSGAVIHGLRLPLNSVYKSIKAGSPMTLDKVERDIIAAERSLREEAFLRRVMNHRATLHDEVETYLRQLSTDLVVDSVLDDFPVFKIRWHHKDRWVPRETVLHVT